MGMRKDIITILFGAVGTALLIQANWISSARPFWDNAIATGVIMMVSRILGRVFGK
jgi:hypothetical protein